MMSRSMIGECNDQSGCQGSARGNAHGTIGGASTIVAVSNALSFMRCIREASPSLTAHHHHPHPHHHYHHHHHHHHHHDHHHDRHHALVMDDFSVEPTHDIFVKEPKKRRFHPLRGLRRIFRRKSRNSADSKINFRTSDDDSEAKMGNNEEVSMEYLTGKAAGIRSKSTSELLTDSSDKHSVFSNAHETNQSYPKLRNNAAAHLSISYDSIFAEEVPHTRPLLSLDTLNTPWKRPENVVDMCLEKTKHLHHEFHNNGVRHGVLEQIRITTENRYDGTSGKSIKFNSHDSYTAQAACYQPETENFLNRRSQQDEIEDVSRQVTKENIKQRWMTLHQDEVDEMLILPTADLPEFVSSSLNHTAAHHRISVRPKNRRPPRRTPAAISNSSETFTATTTVKASMNIDTIDSSNSVARNIDVHNEKTQLKVERTGITGTLITSQSSTTESFEQSEIRPPKIPEIITSLSPDSLDMSITTRSVTDICEMDDECKMKCGIRKQYGYSSKTASDELEILELAMNKTSSIFNKRTKSPDGIITTFLNSSGSIDKLIENTQVPSTFRRHTNYISKSSDGFVKQPIQSNFQPILKKLASKSSDTVDNLERFIVPVTEQPKHSNHSNAMNQTVVYLDSQAADISSISDYIAEHKCSDYQLLPRGNNEIISTSSEHFQTIKNLQEIKKMSNVNENHPSSSNSCNSGLANKPMSKSTESFNTMSSSSDESKNNIPCIDKYFCKKPPTDISLRCSDNLCLPEQEENGIIQKLSSRLHTSNIILCENTIPENSKKHSLPAKQSLRLQKSLENSEHADIDTPIINKHKDSNFTAISEGESNVSDANYENYANDSNYEYKNDNIRHRLLHTDQYYWGQGSNSEENIDIHQLLAIAIVSRITDNTNHQDTVAFSRNNLKSLPTSPIVKQEGNKLLLNNFLGSENNEELQNMLNGNISEVSTDTKSFKEKLIMFEKLGK